MKEIIEGLDEIARDSWSGEECRMNLIARKAERLRDRVIEMDKARSAEELLAALEAITKSAEFNCDVILCYDEEDGFWLAAVERGTTRPHPVYEDNLEKRRGTLEEAILAAVDWNNKEGRKPFSFRRQIARPADKKAGTKQSRGNKK